MIDASKTSVLRNIDIAMVLVWQILFLHQLPTVWSVVGLLLICGCTLVIALTKSASLPDKEPKKDAAFTQIEMDIIAANQPSALAEATVHTDSVV